jgi:hypothetical protein
MHKITYSLFKVLLLVTLYCGVFHNSIPLVWEAGLAFSTIFMGYVMTRQSLWQKTRKAEGLQTLFFLVDIAAIVWACFHEQIPVAVIYGLMSLVFFIDLRKSGKNQDNDMDMDVTKQRVQKNPKTMAQS